jgi:hypothetical protein
MNNLKALQKISSNWENTQSLECLEKTAAVNWAKFFAPLLKPLSKISDKVIDVGTSVAKNGMGAAAASIPISAVLTAVMAKNITSPEALAENSDKYLLLNTLDTEIAVLNRRIAAEELRREELKNKNDKKAYDRFV